jgi:hypothetical protein
VIRMVNARPGIFVFDKSNPMSVTPQKNAITTPSYAALSL